MINSAIERILLGNDEVQKEELLEELGFDIDTPVLKVLNVILNDLYQLLQYYPKHGTINEFCEAILDSNDVYEFTKILLNDFSKKYIHDSQIIPHIPFNLLKLKEIPCTLR